MRGAWRWLLVAAVVGLTVAVAGLVAPASADQTTQLQTARDTLANCQLLAANSTGEQKARAEACIQDQARIVELLTAPSPTPTTPAPSATPPTPSPSTPTTAPAAPLAWPNPGNTGVPLGWAPTSTRTGTWTITQAGTYADVRVIGGINVLVPGVTLRRVSVEGGRIWAEGSRCVNGLTLDQVTVRPAPSQQYLHASDGAVGPGGYTARRVSILDADEGFRVSGRGIGCGKTVVENSFVRLRTEAGRDTHADGVQLYDGGALDVHNVTVDWQVSNGTTAFFAPAKDSNVGPVKIDRLLLKGGGHALTLGLPGSVTGYRYVAGSAVYSPGNVRCDRLTLWEARTVTIGPDYQPTGDRGPLACPAGSGI